MIIITQSSAAASVLVSQHYSDYECGANVTVRQSFTEKYSINVTSLKFSLNISEC